MPQLAACDNSIYIAGLEHLGLIVRMNTALGSNKKPGSHLHALGTQHECCGNTTAVADSACSNDRDRKSIRNLRHKGHGVKFAYVAAGLTALCHNSNCAQLLHPLCQHYRRNYRNNLDPSLLPHWHILGRVSRTCGHYRHLHVGNNLGNLCHMGAHQHDVDTEGLPGQASGSLNLLPKVVGTGIHSRYDSQSASLGDSCSQLSVGNPGHSPLEDRILNSQDRTEFGVKHSLSP